MFKRRGRVKLSCLIKIGISPDLTDLRMVTTTPSDVMMGLFQIFASDIWLGYPMDGERRFLLEYFDYRAGWSWKPVQWE